MAKHLAAVLGTGQTKYVAKRSDVSMNGLVREAILRELDRGGQVYFVHNRVQSIEIVHRRLRELVPEARFLIGHGQMAEDQLEKVMLGFSEGEAERGSDTKFTE